MKTRRWFTADDDACSHIESLNQTTAFGNPPNASLH